jgi:hypothetical protein
MCRLINDKLKLFTIMDYSPHKKIAFPGFVVSVVCAVEARIACQHKISVMTLIRFRGSII